jgi:rubredoxin
MTDCQFTLNADHLWQCSQCGWVYPRASDKPPRRNCPKAPDAPPRQARTRREAVLARYDAQQLTEPPRAEIERRLDVCEACDQYADYECVRGGSPCRREDRWQERVLLGSCEKLKL